VVTAGDDLSRARWEQTGKAANRVEVSARPNLSAFELSRAVTRVYSIRGIDKVVLRCLVDHYPSIWPSLDTLARLCGFCVTATRDALRRLKEQNWIQPLGGWRGGRHRTHQYEVDVERILAESENPPPRGPFAPSQESLATVIPTQNPLSGVPKPSARRVQTLRLATENPPPREPEVISKQINEENKKIEQRFAPQHFENLFSQLAGRKRLSEMTDQERTQRMCQLLEQIEQLKARGTGA
jgi:hypothetical protein